MTGGTIVTVHVPLALRKRSRKAVIIAPAEEPSRKAGTEDGAPLRALARAFWWRKLLETGVRQTIGDLAKAEGVTGSYVSRILRLTLLSPEIVLATVNARRPQSYTLPRLSREFPLEWARQDAFFTCELGRAAPGARWEEASPAAGSRPAIPEGAGLGSVEDD